MTPDEPDLPAVPDPQSVLDRQSGRGRTGFAALLTAETVSTAGTRMSQIAVPWLVLSATGDPVTAGLVGLAEILPYVVLQVLGAPLVDRLGGYRVAVVGNLGAGIALAGVPLLAEARDLGLAALLGCVFVAGLLRGPADSATQVLLPGVAAAGRIPIDRAVGALDGAQRAAGLLGAPLGAALVGLIGSPAVVALDAGTFVVAAALVGLAVPRAAGVTRPADDNAGAGYLTELRVGLLYLVRDRLLRSIAGMVLVTNLVDAAISGLLLLVWARERYGSAGPVGIVGAAIAGGAVVGALVMTAVGQRLPRRWTFAVGFLAAGAPRLVILAVPVPLWVVVAVWAISGLGAGVVNPTLGAAEYDTIPRRLQAWMLSALGGIAWAGIPFGALLAGVLVDAVGLQTALIVGAAVYGLATLDPFLRPAWRLMDRRPSAPRATSEIVSPSRAERCSREARVNRVHTGTPSDSLDGVGTEIRRGRQRRRRT